VSRTNATVRWLRSEGPVGLEACSRCQAQGCPWDRLAGHAVCPDCQQLILLGQSEPLRLERRPGTCSVCRVTGVVSFQTVPLRSARLLEIDVCPEHLEGLLGRRLTPRALQRLADRLGELGLTSKQIFLLHESFYDLRGRALQPVPEVI
jgi:hypothetical protein